MTGLRDLRPFRAAWLLVPWLPALALGGGCGHGKGGGGTGTVAVSSSSSGTGAPTCGLPAFPDATCDACMTTHCCAELDTCASQKSCKDAIACSALCNFDPSCIAAQCSSFAMQPTSARVALDECARASCSAACPILAPNCDQPTNPLGQALGQTCDACIKTKCCDAFTADVEWLDYQKCALDCADGACLRACEASHPAAVAKLTAQGTCLLDTCQTECAHPDGCGFFQFTSACASCAHDNCCAQQDACSRSGSCMNLATCLTFCTPEVDCDACLRAWPPREIGLALSIPNCVTAACPACFNGPGCGLEYSSAPAACQSCIRSSCCAESSACGVDADCIALEECIELCNGDAACVANCKTAVPAGGSLFDPLAMCEAAHCPACN